MINLPLTLRPQHIALLILVDILSVVLALLVPFVVLFARWDYRASTFDGGARRPVAYVRGDLPPWAQWWQTFDERLPGGMYEPSVREVYETWGRYVCSVYWLTLRNRMFGFAKWLFGVPYDGGDRPWTTKIKGPVMVGWGWKKYRATGYARWDSGPFVWMPSFTIRRASRQ